MLQDNEKFDPSCYFTYEKFQWEVLEADGTIAYCDMYDNVATLEPPSLPKKMEDNKQETPTFKPTWLLDTSDMSVVLGSEVCEPYYTLSYSWNQSGDYFKNEHDDGYTRIDRGQHKIVLDPASTDTDEENKTPPVRVRYVKFEDLVQEICQDFGARYLWWDQMCIDQSNKEEKRREIKQMHKIYENACRTIVLVPEVHRNNGRNLIFGCIPGNFYVNMLEFIECQWSKRVWTLVEAFKSNRLLFVGRNVHMYSETFRRPHKKSRFGESTSNNSWLSTMCIGSKKWNVCLALSMAKKRATTKKHDYYFAFANMFPEKLGSLKFSYGQDIQELALEFYLRVAQNDPTILFFGAPMSGEEKSERKILGFGLENIRLPSWTGIDGVHPESIFTAGEFNQSSFGLSDGEYIVSGSTIQVTCAVISVLNLEEEPHSNECVDDIPAFANINWVDPNACVAETGEAECLVLKRLCSFNNKLIFLAKADPIYSIALELNLFGLKTTHFLPAMMDSSYQYQNIPVADRNSTICGELMLTEDCDSCIILYGMRHVWTTERLYRITAPVITKYGEHYKSVGLCIFTENLVFPDIDTETKQTFVIR